MRYSAGFQLGVTSDTEDIWGKCTPTGKPLPGREAVEEALSHFRGEIMQVPPMYSALSVGGKRLYDLARQGITVERQPRPVTIYRLELTGYAPETGSGSLDVCCSKGTYIRTLCADLGQKLGTGGVMSSLRRTEAAGFKLEEAVTLETVAEWMQNDGLQGKLLPAERLFAPYPAVKLNAVQTRMFLNGVRLDLGRIYDGKKASTETPWRIFGADGVFLGLGQAFPEKAELRLLKFFVERN